MTDGCVRLGDDVSCVSCSTLCDVDCAIDGAIGVDDDVEVNTALDDPCGLDNTGGAVLADDPDETAAAAAAAYRMGGKVAGGRGGRPALRMLDIGCWAKFGLGGGFEASVRCK